MLIERHCDILKGVAGDRRYGVGGIMKILSIDIESCTGRFTNASICSFGYCIADENFNIIEQKDIIINPIPKKFFNGRASKAGIQLAYPEEVFRQSYRFDHYYSEIASLFEGALVIGFAIDNDVKYLNNACDYFHRDRIKYKFIDVQILHRVVNDLPNCIGLSAASEQLHEEFIPHRSDEDARMTLLVLKNMCESAGLSANELAEKYAVYAGENRADDFTPCIAKTDEIKKLSKDRTKNKNILIHNFIERLPRRKRNYGGEYYRKNVCFSKEILGGDVDLTRKMIKKVYDLGGKFVMNISSANIYVAKNREKFISEVPLEDRTNDRGVEVFVIEYAEFLQSLGALGDIDFSSDEQILKKHYKKVQNAVKSAKQPKNVAKPTNVSSKSGNLPTTKAKNKSGVYAQGIGRKG